MIVADHHVAEALRLCDRAALRRLTEDMSLSARSLASGQFQVAAVKHLDQMAAVVQAFKKQLMVEPIGLLHLERLTFTPADIEVRCHVLRLVERRAVPAPPFDDENANHHCARDLNRAAR